MDESRRQAGPGPVDATALADAGGSQVRLQIAGPHALVNLRGRPDDGSFIAAARGVLGMDLPQTPNRWTGDETCAVLWLGPDEWLIVAPDGRPSEIERGLREAGGDDPWLSVVDVSHNYTGLFLTGDGARAVLAKGCPLDLHPRHFSYGDCAQTVLAQTRVLLRVGAPGDRIECWVRNSFARYAALWLIDAMAEYRDETAGPSLAP